MLVSTWLSVLVSNTTFHLQLIWLQNFVAINAKSCQRSFTTFCTSPLKVAVLLDWNLSRHPFFGQVVNVVLLLCTGLDLEHEDLFLCPIFIQATMSD